MIVLRQVPVLMFTAVVMVGSVACTSDQSYPKADEPCLSDTTIVSFSMDIVPIFTTYCTNPAFGDCHQSGASNPNLTSYDVVRAEIEAGILTDRVFGPYATGGKMPPSFCNGCPQDLERCDQELLQKWIEQGYANN